MLHSSHIHVVLRICHEIILLLILRWIEVLSNLHIAILAILNDVVNRHQKICDVLFIVDVQGSESNETEVLN